MVKYFCDHCKDEITEQRVVVQIFKPGDPEPFQRDYHKECYDKIEPKLRGLVL